MVGADMTRPSRMMARWRFDLRLLRSPPPLGTFLRVMLPNRLPPVVLNVKWTAGRRSWPCPARGVGQVAAVDLGRARRFGGIVRIELRIARQDEVLDFLAAALLFGQVAVLAFAAKNKVPLQTGRLRLIGKMKGLVHFHLRGRVAVRRIGAGGVVEVEGVALLRAQFDPAIGDDAFLIARQLEREVSQFRVRWIVHLGGAHGRNARLCPSLQVPGFVDGGDGGGFAGLVVVVVGQDAELQAADLGDQVLDALHFLDGQVLAAAGLFGHLANVVLNSGERRAVVRFDEILDLLGIDALGDVFDDIRPRQRLDDGERRPDRRCCPGPG